MSESVSAYTKKMKYYRIFNLLFCCMLVLLWGGCEKAPPEGWMTYRHDKTRSGITDERLSPP